LAVFSYKTDASFIFHHSSFSTTFLTQALSIPHSHPHLLHTACLTPNHPVSNCKSMHSHPWTGSLL
jgi:hypothetical protein